MTTYKKIIIQKDHTANIIQGMKNANNSTWKQKYLQTILYNYSAFPFFKTYFPKIEEIILSSDENLISLNNGLMMFIKNILNINPTIIHAFDLKPNGKRIVLFLGKYHKKNLPHRTSMRLEN